MNIIEKLGIFNGPWEYDGRGAVITKHDSCRTVSGKCDCYEYYGGHVICESVSRTHAELCSAAPEMLEALIIRTYDSYKSIHSCGMTGGFRNGYIEQTRRHISIIEKATGKKWQEIVSLLEE